MWWSGLLLFQIGQFPHHSTDYLDSQMTLAKLDNMLSNILHDNNNSSPNDRFNNKKEVPLPSCCSPIFRWLFVVIHFFLEFRTGAFINGVRHIVVRHKYLLIREIKQISNSTAEFSSDSEFRLYRGSQEDGKLLSPYFKSKLHFKRFYLPKCSPGKFSLQVVPHLFGLLVSQQPFAWRFAWKVDW